MAMPRSIAVCGVATHSAGRICMDGTATTTTARGEMERDRDSRDGSCMDACAYVRVCWFLVKRGQAPTGRRGSSDRKHVWSGTPSVRCRLAAAPAGALACVGARARARRRRSRGCCSGLGLLNLFGVIVPSTSRGPVTDTCMHVCVRARALHGFSLRACGCLIAWLVLVVALALHYCMLVSPLGQYMPCMAVPVHAEFFPSACKCSDDQT